MSNIDDDCLENRVAKKYDYLENQVAKLSSEIQILKDSNKNVNYKPQKKENSLIKQKNYLKKNLIMY